MPQGESKGELLLGPIQVHLRPAEGEEDCDTADLIAGDGGIHHKQGE